MSRVAIAIAFLGVACSLPQGTRPQPMDEDAFLFGVPTGAAQMAAHCKDAPTDFISSKFCANPPPVLHGLKDLQALLGLEIKGQAGDPGFVLLGHSSSLVARNVSALNPRAMVFAALPAGGFVVMTFSRGEQFVELANLDPAANAGAGELAFYLVRFYQACNATDSCTYGDLMTPALEKSWTSAVLYEDDELQDTAFDCLQCHQDRAGAKFLRMQEKSEPFTHFFSATRPGGKALLADFHAAHGTTEDYGPIPAALVDQGDPAKLSAFLDQFGFAQQPNAFDAAAIEREVEAAAPGQPAVNAPPGTSATWQKLWDAYAAGQFIAPPWHDAKVTDPVRLTAMTSAYKKVMSGQMPPSDLPDIRQVFQDEAEAALFRVRPGMSGADLLVQACSQCHGGQGDQTISRARFDVTRLAQMPAEERQLAVDRMHLPDDDPKKMPPLRFRELSGDEIGRAAAVLAP